MQHSWTSHLSIWDNAASVEHKVDIFSKPPRVKAEEITTDADGWVNQHVVAQMKKTDRPKDWPIVDGLGQRLWAMDLATGLLHMTDLRLLRAAWDETSPPDREDMARRRPLLRQLHAPLNAGQFDRLFMLERLTWERVNEERHGRYTRAWKDFYRRWWKEYEWEWPTSEPFWMQHKRAAKAVRAYGLPANPLADSPREGLVAAAVKRLVEAGFPENEVAPVLPPVDELLP